MAGAVATKKRATVAEKLFTWLNLNTDITGVEVNKNKKIRPHDENEWTGLYYEEWKLMNYCVINRSANIQSDNSKTGEAR